MEFVNKYLEFKSECCNPYKRWLRTIV